MKIRRTFRKPIDSSGSKTGPKGKGGPSGVERRNPPGLWNGDADRRIGTGPGDREPGKSLPGNPQRNRSGMGKRGTGITADREALLRRPNRLVRHISERLCNLPPGAGVRIAPELSPSVVLLVLGRQCEAADPCLILNKRSQAVRQPGDLCCPGGAIMPRADAALGSLLFLAGSPLRRWLCWPQWRKARPSAARSLARVAATGLREAFEEMRLNPLRLRFLGPLPPERLRLFGREIHPLAVWADRQRRFRTNWEVERVVTVPIRHLLDPGNYACFRVSFARNGQAPREVRDFPCVRYADESGEELLWGATFRIVSTFLQTVFDFQTPEAAALPRISGTLNRGYMTGKGRGEPERAEEGKGRRDQNPPS